MRCGKRRDDKTNHSTWYFFGFLRYQGCFFGAKKFLMFDCFCLFAERCDDVYDSRCRNGNYHGVSSLGHVPAQVESSTWK